MIYLTVRNTSGGNHGHQLKDLIGGLTIARFLGFQYVHTYYPYLEFAGIGFGEKLVNEIPNDIDYLRIGGPFWGGINFENLHKVFDPIIIEYKEKDVLISIENAFRLFPFQTIKWQELNLIENEVFTSIAKELTNKYLLKNKDKKASFDESKFNIALHINRGTDNDKEKFPDHFSLHTNVRYMFPIDYYQNVIDQLKEVYNEKDYLIHVYTEELGSEEFTSKWNNDSKIKFHIGENREVNSTKASENIFNDFVKSDVLVACNSSFSVMASYFRYGKKTVYHPHDHLKDLSLDFYIPTQENGNFDKSLLNVSTH